MVVEQKRKGKKRKRRGKERKRNRIKEGEKEGTTQYPILLKIARQ
jgi:hypothetical protein